MNEIKTPITVGKLEETLNYILTEIGYTKTIDINYDLFGLLYNRNTGSSIMDLLSTNDFNAIYEGIVNGDTFKTTKAATYLPVAAAWCYEIPTDNFKYFEIIINDSFYEVSGTNTLKQVIFGISKFDNTVYLDTLNKQQFALTTI